MKIKLTGIAVLAALSLGSCKKCVICSAKHTTTGLEMLGSGEYCGTKKEVKDYEDGLRFSYPPPDYTVTCSGK